MTECTTEKLIFEGVGRRRVEADFSAGQVSSDGGVLLVREADRRIGLSERMAECFIDYRDSKQIEHSVKDAESYQRAVGFICGPSQLPLFSRQRGATVVVGGGAFVVGGYSPRSVEGVRSYKKRRRRH